MGPLNSNYYLLWPIIHLIQISGAREKKKKKTDKRNSDSKTR